MKNDGDVPSTTRVATARRAGLLGQRAAALFGAARGQFVTLLPPSAAAYHSCLPTAQLELLPATRPAAMRVGLVRLREPLPGEGLSLSWCDASLGIAARRRQIAERLGRDHVCNCARCRFDEGRKHLCCGPGALASAAAPAPALPWLALATAAMQAQLVIVLVMVIVLVVVIVMVIVLFKVVVTVACFAAAAMQEAS